MADLLIRGFPESAKRRVERIARKRNSSVNKTIIYLLMHGLTSTRGTEQSKEDRDAAFRRVRELRDELHQKYGKQEDSVITESILK